MVGAMVVSFPHRCAHAPAATTYVHFCQHGSASHKLAYRSRAQCVVCIEQHGRLAVMRHLQLCGTMAIGLIGIHHEMPCSPHPTSLAFVIVCFIKSNDSKFHFSHLVHRNPPYPQGLFITTRNHLWPGFPIHLHVCLCVTCTRGRGGEHHSACLSQSCCVDSSIELAHNQCGVPSAAQAHHLQPHGEFLFTCSLVYVFCMCSVCVLYPTTSIVVKTQNNMLYIETIVLTKHMCDTPQTTRR